MKVKILSLLALITFSGSFAFALGNASRIPMSIAHFKLGEPIDKYAASINAGFPFHDADYPYLTHYEILPFEGFSGGFVATGNCTGSSKIVRIKLKYADSSEEFFQRIKKELEKRYGKPQVYRGDPFHVFVSWKWRFEDKKGKVVSMILEHYSGRGEEYASGTAIKLNYISEIRREESCFKKHRIGIAPDGSGKKSTKALDIDYFLPY
ncbi:hypothetical protein [Thermodesulforhabdus norvegica]|uniref:Uncharacterized protein n=1 Tax=Thermodesulforhabdus norvegica TaxID=39841 RepID=A0A1I4SSZ6_9BACT|nr:hypothetical protein [Thermodesulforhabdus norvegica]SFM67499.1 hypothetical protein SAMN05660836_01144 [Thermodesulforhabdus norvegica]